VVGVDMTPAMLDLAKRAANEMGTPSDEFREGYMETLPVADGWAAVVAAAGFRDFQITWRAEVFDGAPQASSAANFGTKGINFRATTER